MDVIDEIVDLPEEYKSFIPLHLMIEHYKVDNIFGRALAGYEPYDPKDMIKFCEENFTREEFTYYGIPKKETGMYTNFIMLFLFKEDVQANLFQVRFHV